MQQTKNTPTFNMKAVVRETGIKPDTLRAWERRYGLPEPERTVGGHRLYSQRDINTLLWLVAHQQEGLSISHAVELYHRLESEGKDPLLVAGQSVAAQETARSRISPVSGDTLDEIRRAWVGACLTYDETTAERILSEAFAIYQPEQVCFDILQWGLHEIGQGWYEGETTVQQEHFATELAMRRLEAMVAGTPPPSRAGRILVGCPAGEEHTFSPLLITFILRRRGWEVVYLGANVPLDRLETTLDSVHPRLVIFTAQQLVSAASLLKSALMLQEHELIFGYGGRIFNQEPAIRERIPGFYLGERLDSTADEAEKILFRPQPSPVVKPASEDHIQALEHFIEQRAVIENSLWKKLATIGFPYSEMKEANGYLSDNISAALYIGDIELLSNEVGWITGLLDWCDMDESLLASYLNAYKEAVAGNMDERGRLILEWLN